MKRPRVLPTIQHIEVTPETGSVFKIGNAFFGDMLIDFLDAEALTIIQLAGLGPDVLPVFVTGDVTAQALGYHSAFSVANPDGSEAFQTYLYTSWLDPTLVDPIFADVSTFNHENLRNGSTNPCINNLVPDWRYPPKGGAELEHLPTIRFSKSVIRKETARPSTTSPAVLVPIDGADYQLAGPGHRRPGSPTKSPRPPKHGWY